MNTSTMLEFAYTLLGEGVFEVRLLKGKRIKSGFFDDVDTAVSAVSPYNEDDWHVYLNSQPIAGRTASNKITQAMKGGCVSATDVAEIKWLILDLDPVRPSGEAATASQRAEVDNLAQEICDFLTDFPPPVRADSGNGQYLMWKLVNVSETTLKRFIKALSDQFTNDAVSVDTAFTRKTQPIRWIGTDNTKGGLARESAILSLPQVPGVVTEKQLEPIADTWFPVPKNRQTPLIKNYGETIDYWCNWLSQRNVAFSVNESAELTVLRLEYCPIRNHDDGAAAILIHPEKGVWGNCFHQKCQGKGLVDILKGIDSGHEANTAAETAAVLLEDDGLAFKITDPTRLARKLIADLPGRLVARDSYFFLHKDTHYTGVHKKKLLSVVRPQVVSIFENYSRELSQQGIQNTVIPVTNNLMDNVHDSLLSLVDDVEDDPPSWLTSSGVDPANIIAMKNGLLDVNAAAAGHPNPLLPHSSDFFNLWALPYDYSVESQTPRVWEDFLKFSFDDPTLIDLLQEWCGYLLTADTSYEKFMWLYGPPAAGKGTITEVIECLVGRENIAALDVWGLDKTFALDSTLGKGLLIFNEGQDSRQACFAGPFVSRIKQITGGDSVRVEQKHKGSVTLKLPIRIMAISNDAPIFRDASAALFRRLLVLPCFNQTKTPDRHLKSRLTSPANLPGLFNWALQGLIRLRQRGEFTQSTTSDELHTEFKNQGSPVAAFVTNCTEDDGWDTTEALYASFLNFAQSHDLDTVQRNIFVKNLKSVTPRLRQRRKTMDGKQIAGYTGIRVREAHRIEKLSQLEY